MKDLKYETLALEEPGEHLLVVRINRPDVRNAISTQVGADLHDVFTRLINDTQDYRCVILTGTGDKAFCAGGDLKERNGMTDEQWLKQHALFERMTLSLLDCPIPLIGAVNGAAFGGGCELILTCDFAYASTTARFGLPEITLGIMPGAGGTQFLPRTRRRAPRQGDLAHRAAVLRRAGAGMGRGQQALRARQADGRDDRDRAGDRQQRADRDPAGQALDALRHADGHPLGAVLRDRRLQQDGGHAGPARGRARLQREAQAELQGTLNFNTTGSDTWPRHRLPPSATASSRFVPALVDYTNDVVYGDLWERPGLSKRDRSLITVAALIATYRPEQLETHLGRALGNGVTKEEISEIITHLAFYAGWPAAMSAAQLAYTVVVEGKKSE